MADNVTLNSGSGGDTIAADEVAGVKIPRSKIVLGADGASDGDVSAANPLPVSAAALPLPTGAATAAAQGTAQTALAAIQAAVELLDNTVGGTELQVDVVSSALPTGAASAAAQGTAQTALDAIRAAVETLDNAISGSEMQVDVVASLPAGTNNIGDVDVASLPALPAGANKVGAVDLDSDATPGSATPAAAQYVAGTDGTLARGLKTDASGELQIDVLSSALPSGAATSAKQDTAAGLLATIDADTSALAGTVAGAELQVDVVSSALPSGAATSAKQDTLIGHVDGVEALLGTIDGDTSALAGAVAGTEVQVDVVASLPAGTNAIGKLAANSGVDIGDVDVTSLPALPAGTNNIGDIDVLTLPPLPTENAAIKRAAIACSSSGANAIVAAVTAKKIRVLSFLVSASAAVNAKWQSASTDITGLAYMAANGGFAGKHNPIGHFETATGEALNLNLSGAVAVGGWLTYVEV